jgi:lipoprotein-anchoring transpeptidase ErfK/SrfK
MIVYVDGRHAASWPVSTARRGYRTPTGTFRPGRMHRRYFSKKYHGSPMPYSVFFLGGYAIHGTNAVRALGRPASHGCVRLHTENARRLFSLIERYGKRNARIVITR